MRQSRWLLSPIFGGKADENRRHEQAAVRRSRLEAVLFLAREPLGLRKLAQLANLADGTEARTLLERLRTIYDELDLQGCSSHSGRRTFITRAARSVHKAGGSLKDVQELAGHSALTTTERYIEGDRDAQRRLVRMI